MTKIFDEAAYLQRRAVNEAKLTDAGVYAPADGTRRVWCRFCCGA